MRKSTPSLCSALLLLCLPMAGYAEPTATPYPVVSPSQPHEGPPLSIGPDCQLLKDGAPFRAVGVNYYDAFYRRLKDPQNRSYREGFAKLSKAHIPFVRFELLPHWPSEIKYYVAHEDRFFVYLDDFVRDAQKADIGLVPSVFFNFNSLPAAFDEPVSAWGDPKSMTSQFAERFTRTLAARYRGSKVIWMWEFSNEINDWDDVPDAYNFYKSEPKSGTPSSYSTKDNYTSEDMLDAFSRFSNAVHAEDPEQLVEAGYNLPRNNAYHRTSGSLDVDTVAQFYSVVERDNAAAQMSSFHVYPTSLKADYSIRFKDKPVDAEEFIEVAADAAKAACKPMFLGEVGPDTDAHYTTPAEAARDFQQLVDAFVESKGALAALWAFDLPWNDSTNATFENSRANRLEAVIKANLILRGQTPIKSAR